MPGTAAMMRIVVLLLVMGSVVAEKITLFTIPKDFVLRDRNDVRQKNAIMSWAQGGADILLFGDAKGMEDAAIFVNEALAKVEGTGNVKVVKEAVDVNPFGTPLLCSAFRLAKKHSEADVMGFVNADNILLQDWHDAIQVVAKSFGDSPFLAVGQRQSIPVRGFVDVSDPLVGISLRRSVSLSSMPLDVSWAIDYFVYSRNSGLFDEMPEFAVGRAGWDNWVVHHALEQGMAVVDITDAASCFHQMHHRQAQDPQEAEYNAGLASGEFSTIEDATHILARGEQTCAPVSALPRIAFGFQRHRQHALRASRQRFGFVGNMSCPYNCSGHGWCVFDWSTNVSYCECEYGWVGASCEIWNNGTTCPSTNYLPCSGHGVCEMDYNVSFCVCDEGWLGDACSEYSNASCPFNCYMHGLCVQSYNSSYCLCYPNYYGQYCEYGNSDCGPLGNCSDHGYCYNATGEPYCICEPGFYGATCNQSENGTCPYDCFYHGDCVEEWNGNETVWVCACYSEYTGEYCQFYNGTNGTASCCEIHSTPSCINPAIASCVCREDEYCCSTSWDMTCMGEVESLGCGWCGNPCPNNCSMRGECLNGTCLCEPGWVGEDCSVPSCPNGCSGHGVCDHGVCACYNGWSGEDCSVMTNHTKDDCCFVHSSPGCERPTVRKCVCAYQPSCCEDAWTAKCLGIMKIHECGGCSVNTSCCLPHDMYNISSCASERISRCVCEQDPYCCQKAWDAQCVAEVTTFGCDKCPDFGVPSWMKRRPIRSQRNQQKKVAIRG